MLRTIALTLALLIVSGCKVAVIVVEGGEVQSGASGTCPSGDVCINQVVDTTYMETFTAVPDAGWQFVKWNDGDGFICGDLVNPVCVVSNVAGAGIPAVEAIVATDKVLYLMPVFEELPLDTIVDTVVANDGNEWAQPDLFNGLTHVEILAACPSGACSGFLNGWNMDGWTLATAQQVLDLFNSYFFVAAAPPVGGLNPNNFATPMVADGFDFTVWADIIGTTDSLGGFTLNGTPNNSFASVQLVSFLNQSYVNVSTHPCAPDGAFTCSGPDDDGAWIYRTP